MDRRSRRVAGPGWLLAVDFQLRSTWRKRGRPRSYETRPQWKWLWHSWASFLSGEGDRCHFANAKPDDHFFRFVASR